MRPSPGARLRSSPAADCPGVVTCARRFRRDSGLPLPAADPDRRRRVRSGEVVLRRATPGAGAWRSYRCAACRAATRARVPPTPIHANVRPPRSRAPRFASAGAGADCEAGSAWRRRRTGSERRDAPPDADLRARRAEGRARAADRRADRRDARRRGRRRRGMRARRPDLPHRRPGARPARSGRPAKRRAGACGGHPPHPALRRLPAERMRRIPGIVMIDADRPAEETAMRSRSGTRSATATCSSSGVSSARRSDADAGAPALRRARGSARWSAGSRIRGRDERRGRDLNPDGSTGEMSGNGVRIAARWLAARAGATGVTVSVGLREVAPRGSWARTTSSRTWEPSRSGRPRRSTSTARRRVHAGLRRQPARGRSRAARPRAPPAPRPPD